MLKRLIFYVLPICAALTVLILLYAPYLPRLALEGYPQANWPAPGDFATVAGSGEKAAPFANDFSGTAFDAEGRHLFEEKDGRALLIYQGGKLRFEHYADGFGPEARFNSYSMVKSLIGALVLNAHAEGKIESLHDPIGVYLPELGEAEVRALPVADFLSMRSGIAFEPDGVKSMAGDAPKDIEETRINPFGAMARLHMLGLDAVAEGLRTRLDARGSYNYQNVNTAVLGRLLETVYDKPLEQLLSENIWAPAGAGTAFWRRYGPGLAVSPYCCLYATPRDWLRVGLYLASNGSGKCRFLPRALWTQFIGRGLSRESLRKGHYGQHIYQDVLDRDGEALQGPLTYMLGSRGQVVYLMPDRDLVVVRFGERIQLLHSTLYAAWRSIPHALTKELESESSERRADCSESAHEDLKGGNKPRS